jgi:hypothetical protein
VQYRTSGWLDPLQYRLLGNYVVIDVTHFSTTVVELFENGAEYVHVTKQRGDEHAFKEGHPEAKIGGGSSDDYTPTEGYDFGASKAEIPGAGQFVGLAIDEDQQEDLTPQRLDHWCAQILAEFGLANSLKPSGAKLTD